MKRMLLALAFLAVSASLARAEYDERQTEKAGIAFGLKVLTMVVTYTAKCDVPLTPGVFGSVVRKIGGALEAHGLSQEAIQEYTDYALHSGWDATPQDQKIEVCSARTKNAIELLDQQMR